MYIQWYYVVIKDSDIMIREPWKHYAKWNKSLTKDHIIYNLFYMNEISRIGKFI